jgi:membrane carboxypeptidase/penicillin-binding protein
VSSNYEKENCLSNNNESVTRKQAVLNENTEKKYIKDSGKDNKKVQEMNNHDSSSPTTVQKHPNILRKDNS